jgi:hypothetical protein
LSCAILFTISNYINNFSLIIVLDEWSVQHGYVNKPPVLEDPEQELELPYRTLIPGLRGGLTIKLNLEVS